MPEEQQDFVYEGSPDSAVGDFTTLTVPMGAIVRDIAAQVFSSCFARGVEFAPERTPGDYFIALDMRESLYRYARIINAALHATLHALMLQVAADVRPLLIGECTVTDVV